MSAFAAVARAGSFRRAAAELNLRPSTLSHSIRSLEERLAVKLLARTTRSVSMTAAGAALFAEITPALSILEAAVQTVNDHRARPQGKVRLTVPQNAAHIVVAPKIGAFVSGFPDVELEVSINDGFVDIVKEGYDAGIRLGESVGSGMTSIRVSNDIRAAVVAAPGYWTTHGMPSQPSELARHRCINRRYGPGRAIHRWRFWKGNEEVELACRGPLVLDAEWLMLEAARQGAGIAFVSEADVVDDLAAGRLQRVLEEWCPPAFAYYLYHSSHRLPSASLAAIIETLRR